MIGMSGINIIDFPVEHSSPKMKKVTPEYGWKDIDHEIYRTYVFPNGAVVKIDRPVLLKVSKNGHRVLDRSDKAHYIPNGWIHLFWETDDENAFRF